MLVPKENAIHGYKMFKPDWSCLDKKYTCPGVFHEGVAHICYRGMHFCQKLDDCLHYYSLDKNYHIAEVRGWGNVERGSNKCCVTDLEIIREISWDEAMKLLNFGEYNEGYHNTGDENYGTGNAGSCNVGRHNSGDDNYGDWNTGYCNYGNCNVGGSNVGYRNSGSYNFGNYNTGIAIVGNYGSGAFCYYPETDLRVLGFQMFNKPLPDNLSRPAVWYICRAQDIADCVMGELYAAAKSEAQDIYNSGRNIDPAKDHFPYGEYFWRDTEDEDYPSAEDLPNFDVEIFTNICRDYYNVVLHSEYNCMVSKDKMWGD